MEAPTWRVYLPLISNEVADVALLALDAKLAEKILLLMTIVQQQQLASIDFNLCGLVFLATWDQPEELAAWLEGPEEVRLLAWTPGPALERWVDCDFAHVCVQDDAFYVQAGVRHSDKILESSPVYRRELERWLRQDLPPVRPRVLLVIQGGVLQDVCSDQPLDYLLKDWDHLEGGGSFDPTAYTAATVCTAAELAELAREDVEDPEPNEE